MKPLNKAVVYAVIAILLGSVTMFAPLALLGSNEIDPAKYFTIGASDNETGSQGLLDNARGNENFSSLPPNSYTPGTGSQPNESCLLPAETASSLSQVGLLVVPSFLVALGIFVYFKKRSY
jgi:hypothetical protein